MGLEEIILEVYAEICTLVWLVCCIIVEKEKPWVRLDANRPCSLGALWAPYDLLQTPFALES